MGPYDVVRKCADNNYLVDINGRHALLHINALRKYEIDGDKGKGETDWCPDVSNEGASEGNPPVTVPIVITERRDDDAADRDIIDPEPPPSGEGTVTLGEQLTEDQIRQLLDIVTEYSDVFAEKLGTTHIAKHRIVVTDQTPCYQPSYPIPEALREPLQRELEAMEANGVIQYTPLATWNSPLVLVRKSNGTLRICNNFIPLNKRTVPEPYLMTNTVELLNRVAGAKDISRLDLKKSYFQVELEEQSQKYTSFQSPFGTFSYVKMPMGLINASSTLQRIMDIVLKGAHVYADKLQDDVIVWSNDFSKHKQDLTDVLNRLRHAGLTLNVNKCHLASNQIKIFGFQVNNGLITPDPEKVQAVSDWPTPKTKKELKSFLGLAGFFRGHIANFAEIAYPLTELLTRYKPERLQWTGIHEEAFQKLKQALISRPVLCPPDMTQPFQIYADSSKTSISAVLMQTTDEAGSTPRVISYASRKLLPRESNYSTIERECLSIVFAVTKFRHYIFARKVVVMSDHKALTWLNSIVKSSSRLAKWALILQDYDLEIRYVPGSHQLADVFTRLG